MSVSMRMIQTIGLRGRAPMMNPTRITRQKNLTKSGLAAMVRGPTEGGLAFAQGPRGGMPRFGWFRVLLPGLCAGLIPACFSPSPGPSPSPYVRSGKPLELSPLPAVNRAPPIARTAAPEESLTRIGYQTDAGRVPVVFGMSATGLPLRPREDALSSEKPQPVLLASAVQRKAAAPVESAAPRKLPKSITDEPNLVAAMRCYLEKRPSDAAKELI